jgi:hypothetical protein
VDVEKMAVEVETARTGTKRHSEDHTSTEVLDIPDEVLDDCQKTFVTAQNIFQGKQQNIRRYSNHGPRLSARLPLALGKYDFSWRTSALCPCSST